MDRVMINLLLGVFNTIAKTTRASAKASAELRFQEEAARREADLKELKVRQEFELQRMQFLKELELEKLRLQLKLERLKTKRAEAEAEAERWKHRRQEASSDDQWRAADSKAYEARASAEATADQVLRTEAEIRTSEEAASALTSNDPAALGRWATGFVIVSRPN